MGRSLPILAWLVVAALLLPARYLRVQLTGGVVCWNRVEGRLGGEGRRSPRC
jgi:hypothetical protein